MSNQSDSLLEKVATLAKRRGFVYPSSEIYGGLANTYDFGPYGAELKENIRQLWWNTFVRQHENIYGIDASIIINPKIWQASGHVASFADVMVEDKKTHNRYRADHLIEEYFTAKGEEVKVDGKTAEELQEIIEKEDIKSPQNNPLTKARNFNQLFQTEIGIIVGEGSKAYLRGEIAQGIFVNYKNILDSIHPALPFGIAQTGKAFRNEITKGQFTFRTLEFDLMEFEYFFDPHRETWEELFEEWKDEMYAFARTVGLREDHLRWREHESFELSHYSKRTYDLEYKFPWGYKEMFGLAYRTDFDLQNHQKNSGANLAYTYADGSKIIPHVIEPTFGLSRLLTVILMDAYREDKVNGEDRVFLRLDPAIAPVKAAILPLIKKPQLQQVARQIYEELKAKLGGWVVYDETASIGKRYRRQDEIGTPSCITIDFESLDDHQVTVRDRDSLRQERVDMKHLADYLVKTA
jgi:glycyl-tRNA synthetase